MASDDLCGAVTKSGTLCRNRGKLDGRCARHVDAGSVRSGAELRASVLADYQLSRHETEVLDQVCAILDTILALEEVIEADGHIVEGSKGQPVLNPAIPELRQQRLAIARLLSQLRLPVEGGRELASPESVRARTAAQARWRHRDEVEAEREQLRDSGRPSSLRHLRAVDPAGV